MYANKILNGMIDALAREHDERLYDEGSRDVEEIAEEDVLHPPIEPCGGDIKPTSAT